MDNYPARLAPPLDHDRNPALPFEQWWPQVQPSWPNVPAEVAREWLHRHWGQSPFGWLPSARYKFERVTWPASSLDALRYRLNHFADDGLHEHLIGRGKIIFEADAMAKGGLWLVRHMVEHGNFPSPPVILDNRDGHLIDEMYGDPNYYPHTYLVIEGHTRFELGYYLRHTGAQMTETLEFFVMTNPAG